jgi:hypothetical protein
MSDVILKLVELDASGERGDQSLVREAPAQPHRITGGLKGLSVVKTFRTSRLMADVAAWAIAIMVTGFTLLAGLV